MPVLITYPVDFETWISAPTADAFKLARSYAVEQMRIVQSGAEREDLLVAYRGRQALSAADGRPHKNPDAGGSVGARSAHGG